MTKTGIQHHYSLLLFGIAAMAFGLRQLLMLGTQLANIFAAITLFLGIAVVVSGIVHFWRFG